MIDKLPPFEEWLARNSAEIADMIEFSKCNLQPSASELNEAGADINAKAANAGFLLADAEVYLIGAKAQALRDMPDDLGPTGSKVYIEDKTKELRRLRDNLRTICRTLKSMAIACCSVRKYSGGSR